jgi:hypothetical protein
MSVTRSSDQLICLIVKAYLALHLGEFERH